jgi:hypothetical protein
LAFNDLRHATAEKKPKLPSNHEISVKENKKVFFWAYKVSPCSISSQKMGQNAGFGPTRNKKIALLQPAFLEFHVTP